MAESLQDALAHMHFPAEHYPQPTSTNTREHLNMESKREGNVVATC